jgi:C1A family cysteine protease
MPFDKNQIKSSIIESASGIKFKIGGYLPDPEDSRDYQYSSGRFQKGKLPPKVDLREYMTEVEQQGELNSCTANAMAGAYEYLAMRELGESGQVSRLFVYYNARAINDRTDQDKGTYLRNCIKVLRKYGTCRESTWPYEPEKVFEEPHETAYEEASNYLLKEARRVNIDLFEMKHCLAEGYPFAFGMRLYSGFKKAGRNGGKVSLPDPDSEKSLGGHAMLCVGYSETDKVFLVRNSWGKEWGDEGYCYIPYDYMTNPEFTADCWMVVSVADVDFSEGVWGDSTSFFDPILPLVEGVSEDDEDGEYEEDEDGEYEEDEEQGFDDEEEDDDDDDDEEYDEDDEEDDEEEEDDDDDDEEYDEDDEEE